MKKGLTDLVCIIDKSGSMVGKESDVVGGYNKFLKEQKRTPGKARISLTLFDTNFQTPYISTDIHQVRPMLPTDYRPDGMTALLDAVGQAIEAKGRELAAVSEEDRPEQVIVTIITDGQENSSKNYTKSKLKEMIQHQQDKYSWKFIFLGANQDAFAEASQLGIWKTYTSNYNPNDLTYTYSAYSTCVSSMRSGDYAGAATCMASLNDSAKTSGGKADEAKVTTS